MHFPEDHPDPAYLWDMLVRLRELDAITRGRSLDDLLGNRLLQLSVERLIETIGEAARNVSSTTRGNLPYIPWRGIIAQRHVLAHDYGAIDHLKLWRIVTEHAPTLRQQLEELLPEPPENPYPEPDR